MKKIIRRALTKTVREKRKEIEVPPSEHIVWIVCFATVCLIGLIVLEAIHMIRFGSWNTEIFGAITGLVGTITGIFLSRRA
ncbi:MAG: hypothetical protein ACE5NN_01800 [Candidatus Bathyarchaeia archaeon]